MLIARPAPKYGFGPAKKVGAKHGIVEFTITIEIFLVDHHQSGSITMGDHRPQSITNLAHTYVIPYKKEQFEYLDFASQSTSSSAVN